MVARVTDDRFRTLADPSLGRTSTRYGSFVKAILRSLASILDDTVTGHRHTGYYHPLCPAVSLLRGGTPHIKLSIVYLLVAITISG